MKRFRRKKDDWQAWWDGRLAAMETVLGKCDDIVDHPVVPFDVGFDNGGAADIVYFRQHLDGVGYATCELIGRDGQVLNALGNYELLIFHRKDDDWGPNTICKLAYYTLDAVLNPGDTMDLGPASPNASTIAAFLFIDYARFKVLKRDAGLLLCLGITSDELTACRAGDRPRVEAALKSASVYPFTDLYRSSVLS